MKVKTVNPSVEPHMSLVPFSTCSELNAVGGVDFCAHKLIARIRTQTKCTKNP